MSEEKDEFGIPFIGADGACDHLRHAMMAESTGRRVCQSCQIKSLESRLKTVREVESARYEHDIEELKQRLSKAEALNEKLYSERTPDLKADKIGILEARLSHLMDVAGKMADVLKPFSGSYYHTTIGNTGNCIISMKVCEDAKAMLAEWDGIKEAK